MQAEEVYAAAVAHALLREEQLGRKPHRISEPRLATWLQFAGNLTGHDFLELLCEDAAVTQPFAFEAPDHVTWLWDVNDWILGAWQESLSSGPEYVAQQASHLLGQHWKGTRELPCVEPHDRVLELPGTGGQISYAVLRQSQGLYLQDGFTVVVAERLHGRRRGRGGCGAHRPATSSARA